MAAALSAMECIVVQDMFLNETAKYAHVFLPGSSFLEKDGTFTNAERRISRVRKVMPPMAGYADWEVTQLLSNALGYPMNYAHPSEIMAEIAALTPTFARRHLRADRSARQPAVAVQCDDAGDRHRDHARGPLRARPGTLPHHEVRGQRREGHAEVSAAADHRPDPVAVQRGRADAAHRQQRSGTRRTGWRSTRTTRRIAASRTATGSASRAARAKRCCAPR